MHMDVIFNNMANADSVGYKDERVTSQAFDQVLSIKIRDGSQAYHNQAIGHLSLGVKIGEVYTDYTQGSIRQTHGTYDMAVRGQIPHVLYKKRAVHTDKGRAFSRFRGKCRTGGRRRHRN